MVAETNPNHVAMATGAYGEVSGIPGNAFAVHGATDGGTLPGGDEPVDAAAGDRRPEPGAACAPRRSSGRSSAAAPGSSPRGSSASPSSRASSPGAATAGATTPTTCGRRACRRATTRRTASRCPRRPNDGYSLNDSDVMDEVLRTVREGVRGDGKTFTGGGARPNLTFVNLPGVDSAGHAQRPRAGVRHGGRRRRRRDRALRRAAEAARAVGAAACSCCSPTTRWRPRPDAAR